MPTLQTKILVMRFSSIGDVVQALSIAGRLKQSWPDAEVHWLTRSDMKTLVAACPDVDRLWTWPQGTGIRGVWDLARQLDRQNFSHVYDAHASLRSRLMTSMFLGPGGIFARFKRVKYLLRGKYRWRRFMLFYMRKNLYPKTFTGQYSLLEPLKRWGLSTDVPDAPQMLIDAGTSDKLTLKLQQLADSADWIQDLCLPPASRPQTSRAYIAIAPSASYETKRWPIDHWKRLLITSKDLYFVILGGPQDHFCQDIAAAAPSRCVNFAGSLTLMESAALIDRCDLLISGDTGMLHLAEQLGKRAIALMGPTPFGIPCRASTLVLERELACRPCSKHGERPCHNPDYLKCLRDIQPREVLLHSKGIIVSRRSSTV